MKFEHKTVARHITRVSLAVTAVAAIPVTYFFSRSGLCGYLLAAAASFIYFFMLSNRIARVIPGEKGLAYMLRGFALRLIFIVLAAAVLIGSGFEALAVLPGLLVTPAGNKLYSLYLIKKGLTEFRGG